MCDAAIVLEGEKGAISEAVSVISLGKPVLLAGIAWAKECPVLLRLFEVRDIADYEENILFEKARERLGKKTDKRPMRELIEQALDPGSIQIHDRSRLVFADGVQACPAIAEWLTQIQTVPRKGEFPPLGEQYDRTGDNYHAWLEQVPQPDL